MHNIFYKINVLNICKHTNKKVLLCSGFDLNQWNLAETLNIVSKLQYT